MNRVLTVVLAVSLIANIGLLGIVGYQSVEIGSQETTIEYQQQRLDEQTPDIGDQIKDDVETSFEAPADSEYHKIEIQQILDGEVLEDSLNEHILLDDEVYQLKGVVEPQSERSEFAIYVENEHGEVERIEESEFTDISLISLQTNAENAYEQSVHTGDSR